MPLSPVSSTVEAGLAAIFWRSARTDPGRLALADDAIEAKRPGLRGAKRAHFPPKARRLERALDEERDLLDVEGLVRVVERPLLHRLHRQLDARVPGQHDDEGVGTRLLDLLEHREPVGVGQPVVQEHQIHAFATALVRLGCGLGFEDSIALLGQAAGQRPPNELVRRRRREWRGCTTVSIAASTAGREAVRRPAARA